MHKLDCGLGFCNFKLKKLRTKNTHVAREPINAQTRVVEKELLFMLIPNVTLQNSK